MPALNPNAGEFVPTTNGGGAGDKRRDRRRGRRRPAAETGSKDGVQQDTKSKQKSTAPRPPNQPRQRKAPRSPKKTVSALTEALTAKDKVGSPGTEASVKAVEPAARNDGGDPPYSVTTVFGEGAGAELAGQGGAEKLHTKLASLKVDVLGPGRVSTGADESEWEAAAAQVSERLNLHPEDAAVAAPPEHASAPDVAGPSGREEKLGPDSFDLIRVVGQGAFGKVFQVRHKMTRNVYAMKVMQKQRIVERGHQEYVEMEREVLTAVQHPYIINLRYSFQTSTKLYLVLDFINGGHLFFKLWNEGIFDESETRTMAAEIVLAIRHLHGLGIAHRDLKPENILLDGEGHVKLTDFGLAKRLGGDTRTNSFIGTMEYMAPEIIKGDGHGMQVDWWSLGILVYEMLNGKPPFEAQSRQTLQKQILQSKIKIPKFFSSAASSLIRGLLTRDASKRLGSGPSGVDEIMTHVFFRGIDWKSLEQRQVTSPFKPPVSPVIDCVKNVDKIWTEMAPVDSPCNSPKQELAFQYEDFNYRIRAS